MQSVKNFTGKSINILSNVWLRTVMVVAFCFTLLTACSSDEDKGIIALEGYEYAWILCGEEDQGGFIMVNNGHYHDPELNELMELAATTCPGDNPGLYSQNK